MIIRFQDINEIKNITSSGDAIVNGADCFPDLEWLKQEFDILHFLNFCAGLDALILHNNLFTFGTLTEPARNPLVGVLLNNEILHFCQLVTSDPLASSRTVMEHKRAKQILELLPQHIYADEQEITTQIFASALTMPTDVVYEDLLQVPLVHSVHSLPIYLQIPDVKDELKESRRLVGLLAEKYADFKNTLFALREQADGDDFIRIPPVALEALNRADNLEQLGEVVLEIRDKYDKIRKQFTALDELMRSKDEPPKKKLKEKAKMSKSLNKLFTTDELDAITLTTSLATRMNEAAKIEGVIKDGADLSDINYAKIIGFLIEKAEAAYWKFRLSPLHATKKKYMNLTLNKIAESIEKHFGYKITPEDIKKVEKYSQKVESLKKL